MTKPKAAPPINYEKLFRPLKEWYELDTNENFKLWLAKTDGNGITNQKKYQEKLNQIKANNSLDPIERKRLEDEASRDFDYEIGTLCPPNPALPRPKLTDIKYQHSWIAWRKAASYAGAPLPTYTLSQIQTMVEANVNYTSARLRKWREDPEYFAKYCNELCQMDYRTHSDEKELYRTQVIGKVLAWTHHQLLTWHTVHDNLKALKQLGLKETSNLASNQVKICKELKHHYMNVVYSLVPLISTQRIALQSSFGLGRGEEYVKANDDWDDFESRIKSMANCQSNLILNRSHKDLRRLSYIDSVLAGLCNIRDADQQTPKYDVAHFFLEYEQTILSNKELSINISEHVQHSIGEVAMTLDIWDAITSFFKSGEYIPPRAEDDLGSLFDQELYFCYAIFETDDLATFHDIGVKGYMTPTLADALWKDYEAQAIKSYGDTINDLLRINDILKKPKPQWTYEPTIDTSFPVTETSIAVSGHSHVKTESLSHVERKKTRGVPAPDIVEDHLNEMKISPAAEEAKPKFQVNNKQMKLVRKLFSKAEDEEGQGQVKWEDIYKLMKRLEFRIDEVGGSIVRFVPPSNAGTPFIEHRPHPENNIGGIRYRAFGQGLKERYGWDEDWFQRVAAQV